MRKTGISLALVLFVLALVASLFALDDAVLSDVAGAVMAAPEGQPALAVDLTGFLKPVRSAGAGAMATTVPAGNSSLSADQAQLVIATPVVTPVPTATPVPLCNVAVEGFTARQDRARLQVINRGLRLASMHTVEIAWPVESNGPLTEIWLRDRLIWRGELRKSPASIPVGTASAIPPSILPGESADVTFVFATDDGDEVAETHYVISISFFQGCHVLYSTRQPIATRCKVEAGLFAVRGRKAMLTLHNAGVADAELRAIQVAWPADDNGALIQVRAGAMTLWEGEQASSPTIIRPTEATERPVLRAGERVQVTFAFARAAAEEPYAITFYFVEGCHTFFSTHLRPTTPHTVRLGGLIEALPEDGLLGEWIVAGHTVLVDERTIIEPQNAQPAVGDEVKVTAIVLQDATQVTDRERLLAIHIRLTGDKGGRDIEFRGIIQEISDDGREIIVRGITVIVNEQTQIQGQLAVGSLAHVQGKLLGNDRVLAKRIVVVTLAVDVSLVQFEGPVESFPADGLGEWRIGGRAVMVDAATVIEGTPAVGALAEVQAQLVNGGTLLARHIVIQEERVTPVVVHISGVIVQLPDASLLLGNWVIGNVRDFGNVTVSVTEATFIDQSQARARVGAPVDVHMVRQPDGAWRAIRITVKRED